MSKTTPGNAERLRTIFHDIRHCLHVIGTGLRLIQEPGMDLDVQNVCKMLEIEQQRASELVEELRALANSDACDETT